MPLFASVLPLRPLWDGSLSSYNSRHFVPGYHHFVPPGLRDDTAIEFFDRTLGG